jgi:3-hydroxyisobutyrate dehydrogenase
MAEIRTIAVLGTGTMGAPMARHLLKAGFAVRAWNPTRAKAEAIDGVEVFDTPAEAAAGADAVLTMAPDGAAVEETMFGGGGVAAALGRDAVWFQTSTVGVAAADRFADLARERGIVYIDAPVGGSKAAAEDGKLIVLASGAEEVRPLCEPVFETFAAKIVWVGEAGAGSRMKLVFNNWVFGIMEAVAESVALAEGLGVDPLDFLHVVEGTHLDTPYLQMKGRMIAERSFEPAFKLALARKDAQLIVEAARAAGLELAVSEAVLEHFGRAIELGHADEDMAAVYYATIEGG